METMLYGKRLYTTLFGICDGVCRSLRSVKYATAMTTWWRPMLSNLCWRSKTSARTDLIIRFFSDPTLLYSVMYDLNHLYVKCFWMTYRLSGFIRLLKIRPLLYVRIHFNISNTCAVWIRFTLCEMLDIEHARLSNRWMIQAAIARPRKDAVNGS